MNKPFLTMLLIFAIALAFIFPRGALSVGASNVSFLFGSAGLDNGLGNFVVSYMRDRMDSFREKMVLMFSPSRPGSIFDVIPLWTLIIAAVGLARLVRTGDRAARFFILSAAVVFLSSSFFLADSSPLYRMYLPFFVFVFFCFGTGALNLLQFLKVPRWFSILLAIILLTAELGFTMNSLFWRSDTFPKTSSDIYNPSQHLRMAKSVAFLMQKNIRNGIAVDTIDKGPVYYLKDRGLSPVTISDAALKTDLPRVYFSNYIYLKDIGGQSIINRNYDKIIEGMYLLK